MIELFRELFAPDFLLRHALWITLLLGAVCPIAGCFLILRRMVFLGVALPQISAVGVAAGTVFFSLVSAMTSAGFDDCPACGGGDGVTAGSTSNLPALLGALGATFAGLLLLALLGRRGLGSPEARQGAFYVSATAASLLLLAANPHVEHALSSLLRGEIVFMGEADFALAFFMPVPATALLVIFRREFWLIGFDRDFASAAGRSILLWEIFFHALLGVLIGVAVFIAGPLVCFGLMLLPAFAAHSAARSMRQFFVFAPVFGVTGALAGFAVAFEKDLPTGATVIVASTAWLVIVFLIRAAVRLIRR